MSWRSSKQPRKQRKFLYNAPKHIRLKLMSAQLSDTLKTKYHKNSLPLRKGDTVKIMRGQFKKTTGKITKVLLRLNKVLIDNATITKKDGSKVFYPIHPSNVSISELILEDKRRLKRIEKK
ncbi:50S ribosomal protein L24 [Candidatus Woesearchaeota archaeon]|nr:50S ribosomal protein L24 [Candidatus Woesearchaeota archaeon]